MRKETAIPDMEERKLPEFNAMQRVKRRFFAMRNGDLAQQMAERGANYRINFGLNLPQVSEIARDFLPGGKEHLPSADGFAPLPADFDMADFARRLRDNTSTRESMLIAPMLFPVEALSEEEALEWMRSVPSPEVADVLCLKLLRNHPSAPALTERLLSDESSLARYAALRLALNLLQCGKVTPESLLIPLDTEESRRDPLTASLCRQLRDEINFLME